MTPLVSRLTLAVGLLAASLAPAQGEPSPRVEAGATALHAEDMTLAPGFFFGGSLALTRWMPLPRVALEPHLAVHFVRRNAGLKAPDGLDPGSLAIDSLEIPLLLRGEFLLTGRAFHAVGGVYGSRLLRVQRIAGDGARRSADTDASVDLGLVAGAGLELTSLASSRLFVELRYQRSVRPVLPGSDSPPRSLSVLVGYGLARGTGVASASLSSSPSSSPSGARARSLALRTGLIATRMASSSGKSTFAPSSGPGFSLGAALVPARLGSHRLALAPQLELAFTRHSTESPADSLAQAGSLALDTFDAALLVRGEAGLAGRTIFALGGVYGSVRLGAQYLRDGLVTDARDAIPPLDGGWLAGAGIELTATSRVRLALEVRYQRSLRQPTGDGLTRDSLSGLIGLTYHSRPRSAPDADSDSAPDSASDAGSAAFARAGPRVASTLIGRPGDRWLHLMRFSRIERATRDDQLGYLITYRVPGHGNLALFWPRDRIDLANSSPAFRLRSRKLGKGRLRFPDRITRRSLPRVHHYILEIEGAYAAQADGAIDAMKGFSIIAGLAGLRPSLRANSPRATSHTTSKPSSQARARARARRGRAQQGAANSSSTGAAATGGTAAASGTGQLHHAISRRIHRELQRHNNLAGHYKVRDPRFVTRGVNEAAHRGYQRWHRQLDDEVITWIREHDQATPAQFVAYLRNLYHRAEIRARFPDGL